MKKYNLYAISLLLFFFAIACEDLGEEYNKPVYKNPIKIGLVGDVSVLREQVENIFFGAQLASEEINKFGGIELDGIKHDIELIFKNSAGSATEGIKIVNELIDDSVDIIIGPTFSSVAVEMAKLCIEKEVLMMTYSATLSEITLLEDNDLIWRTCPSDFTFGNVAALYSFLHEQHRKVGILYRNDRFGMGLSEIIRNSFENLSGSVASYVSYPGEISDIDTYDFSFELNSLLKEEVDAIFIISFNSEIAKILNEIYNNDLYQNLVNKPDIILSDGIVPEELIINVNPKLLETIIGITSTNEGNLNYNIYKDNYFERFGFSPATYSEHAYDALYCISYAMQKAQSSKPNEIKNFLREVSGLRGFQGGSLDQIIVNVNEFDFGKTVLKRGESINYEGASGAINFDGNGDPIANFIIWGIENNKYVEIFQYEK